jgi:hypothetical protein
VEPPDAAPLPDTAEPELTDVEEFPSAEVGTEELLDPAAEEISEEAEAAAEDSTETEAPQDGTPEAGAPVRKRRRERRRTRSKKETPAPEAEADEAVPEAGAAILAPATEEGKEAPPELLAEETELLDAAGAPDDLTESPEAAGEDTGEEGDEDAENGSESAEGETAASRNRKRRRRRRRRSGLALREEAPLDGAPADEAPETAPPPPELADTEAELFSAETGADLETEEDVEAEFDREAEGPEEEDEDEEDSAAPSGDGAGADRRARRSRFPNRRDGRRRPAMEQAVIENPSDPSGSPLRVDIQPGVGTRLIGRSIIGFREAYDIGGGDRAAVSFHVMVLDDGSQWRVKGSDEFDPWLERIMPGEED